MQRHQHDTGGHQNVAGVSLVKVSRVVDVKKLGDVKTRSDPFWDRIRVVGAQLQSQSSSVLSVRSVCPVFVNGVAGRRWRS